jgi:hypothetical protein
MPHTNGANLVVCAGTGGILGPAGCCSQLLHVRQGMLPLQHSSGCTAHRLRLCAAFTNEPGLRAMAVVSQLGLNTRHLVGNMPSGSDMHVCLFMEPQSALDRKTNRRQHPSSGANLWHHAVATAELWLPAWNPSGAPSPENAAWC